MTIVEKPRARCDDGPRFGMWPERRWLVYCSRVHVRGETLDAAYAEWARRRGLLDARSWA